MLIDFIGHAGFSVKTQTQSVLFDPWLVSSSFDNPLLKSFAPDAKTIDYLIPEPIHTKEDFSPDLILVSHFHTHHSPAIELNYWLTSATKKVKLVGPKVSNQSEFQNWFSTVYPQHELLLIDSDTDFNLGNLEVKCLTHTIPDHIGYLIKENDKSFLHLADPSISKVWYDRRLDNAWFKFKDLAPNFLSLTVSSTTYRGFDSDGSPYLKENAFLSPVEAAQVTKLINPKNVAVMGIFNFSIWRNRIEYSYPSYEVEGYFKWALNHIKPSIAVQLLRPGYQFYFDDQKELVLKVKTK